MVSTACSACSADRSTPASSRRSLPAASATAGPGPPRRYGPAPAARPDDRSAARPTRLSCAESHVSTSVNCLYKATASRAVRSFSLRRNHITSLLDASPVQNAPDAPTNTKAPIADLPSVITIALMGPQCTLGRRPDLRRVGQRALRPRAAARSPACRAYAPSPARACLARRRGVRPNRSRTRADSRRPWRTSCTRVRGGFVFFSRAVMPSRTIKPLRLVQRFAANCPTGRCGGASNRPDSRGRHAAAPPGCPR